MWTIFWWIIEDKNSELCGKQFFTKLKGGKLKHYKYVKELFPNEEPCCLGQVTAKQAELIGLDTY